MELVALEAYNSVYLCHESDDTCILVFFCLFDGSHLSFFLQIRVIYNLSHAFMSMFDGFDTCSWY